MQALRARRQAALHSPGFRLERYPDELIDRRLRGLVGSDLVIVTSPMAARLVAERPLPVGLRQVRFIVPGSGTASILETAGIAAAWPEDGGTSEHILAMVQNQPRPNRVAIVGAPGGRTLLARELSRRGARTTPVYLYQRVAVAPNRDLLDALKRARNLVVLISSGQAFETILGGLPDALRVDWLACAFVVSSTRIAEVCRSAGARRVRVAAGASDKAMLSSALGKEWN